MREELVFTFQDNSYLGTGRKLTLSLVSGYAKRFVSNGNGSFNQLKAFVIINFDALAQQEDSEDEASSVNRSSKKHKAYTLYYYIKAISCKKKVINLSYDKG